MKNKFHPAFRMTRLICALLPSVLLLASCDDAVKNPTDPASSDTAVGDTTAVTPTETEPEKELTEEEKVAKEISDKQNELKAVYSDFAGCSVKVCGEDKADGKKSVWVEYLSDRDPYPADEDPDKAVIRALYYYYPCEADPSELSDGEKAENGLKRVFAYMGIPENAKHGMVCIHGGGSHASYEYVLEAECNGYAAISFDTNGYEMRKDVGEADPDANPFVLDPLGHKENDNFKMAQNPIEEQWLYWAVGDTVLANSVLRSQDGIDGVGLTGVSWGGLIATTTACYDGRFAFCVPVYIGFHMAESVSRSLSDLPNKPYASALWQDQKLLAASEVPLLMLSSDRDPFSSVNCNIETANDAKNGSVIIKPNYTHTQNDGAAPAEIYRYGHMILDGGAGYITPAKEPGREDGTSYTLTLSVPEDLTDVSVMIGYRTKPLPAYETDTQFLWTVRMLEYDEATGTVAVEMPENTYMYYLSFHGMSEELKEIRENTPFGDEYAAGTLYSSTGVIVLGDGEMTE